MIRLEGRRLLLVEDNPADAQLVRELLDSDREASCSIEHVDSIEAAIGTLARDAPDAILLDLRLPDCEGVDCIRAIRGVTEEVAIVALTGLGSDRLALDCLAEGAQDYIGKNEMHGMGLRRTVAYAIARVHEAAASRDAYAARGRLAAIVEGSSDAIVSCTTEGLLTSWNAGAEAIFGFTAQEALGRPVTEIIRAPDSENGTQQRLFQQAVIGEYGPPRALRRLRKDGTPIDISAVAFPLPALGGAAPGIGAICRDVTELLAQEAELQSQNARLLQRERQMRALTAHLNEVREAERIRISREVHDELGQLLSGLKMDLRWIAKRLPDDPAMHERLGDAVGLAERTMATVQRIATELRPSALDALGLPAAIRDEVRRFEARSGVRGSVRVADGEWPDGTVSTALFRICQELLTNVGRHAAAQTVSVSFERAGEDWVLYVSDDGAGFVHDADADVASLGILGMRERAAQLGGSLTIDSRPGLGTRATVRIPRRQEGEP